MKAKVRIAPVEHWCQEMKAQLAGHPSFSGEFIDIFTESMQPCEFCPCDGKEWRITPESVAPFRIKIFGEYSRTERVWICEHMLELD